MKIFRSLLKLIIPTKTKKITVTPKINTGETKVDHKARKFTNIYEYEEQPLGI